MNGFAVSSGMGAVVLWAGPVPVPTDLKKTVAVHKENR